MNSTSTTQGERKVGRGWLWAVRISLLFSAVSCVPLVLQSPIGVDSFLFAVSLATYLLLGGFLFWRPVRELFAVSAVIGAFAFFILGSTEIYRPLTFSGIAEIGFTSANLALALTGWEAQSLFGSSGAPPPGGDADPRWVAAVRILTIISTLPAWIILALAYAASRGGPCEEKDALEFLFALLSFLPYLGILWHLRWRTRARGLKLAAATGLAWVIPFALPLLVLYRRHDELIPWVIVFAGLQLGLFVSAFKALKTMRSEESAWRHIPRGLALLSGYLLAGFLIIGARPLSTPRITLNQYGAVNSIRAILLAETTYAAQHGGNFSPSLAVLGPPPEAASGPRGKPQGGLIDSVLASGAKSGYLFTYTPSPPDATGRVQSFEVLARPREYGMMGCKGFYANESGVVRFTRDNRPPIAQDPPVGGQ